MRFCNALHDCKPKSGAFCAASHFVTDSIKIIKYIFLFRRRDAYAGICHGENDSVFVGGDRYGDVAWSVCVLNRVFDKVLHQAIKGCVIANYKQAWFNFCMEYQTLFYTDIFYVVKNLLDAGGKV